MFKILNEPKQDYEFEIWPKFHTLCHKPGYLVNKLTVEPNVTSKTNLDYHKFMPEAVPKDLDDESTAWVTITALDDKHSTNVILNKCYRFGQFIERDESYYNDSFSREKSITELASNEQAYKQALERLDNALKLTN